MGTARFGKSVGKRTKPRSRYYKRLFLLSLLMNIGLATYIYLKI